MKNRELGQEQQESKKSTIKEVLAEHGDNLEPEEGDKAYTIYHGKEYIGVLVRGKEGGGWYIVPPIGEKEFDLGKDSGSSDRNIDVGAGFDSASVSVDNVTTDAKYDKERGMFLVEASPD